jgi:DNA modification methylase
MEIENDKIYCGDSLKLLPEFPDKSVDDSFTSPPYNRLRNDKYDEYNDKIEDYFGFLCSFTDQLLRITKRYVIINIQKTMYNKVDVFRFMGKYADKIQEVFVWEKSNPMPAAGNAITNAYEFFFFLSDSPVRSNSTYVKNHITTNVYGDGPKDHKAVMNPEVALWFIKNFTNEGDLILDPFMGYGTTAVCSKALGRHYAGIEISPKYCEEAERRIKDPSASCRLSGNYEQGRLF